MGEGGGTGIPFITGAGKNDGKDGSIGQAFEFLLAEWHLTPEYILANWTDEELALMIDKLVERKKRETEAITGKRDTMSDSEFFKMAGIKVVNHGN